METAEPRLEQLERKVLRYTESKLDAGRALKEIRELRLYGMHCSFEHYCAVRFGLSGRHARNLIDYAATVDNLGTIVPELSTVHPSEGTLRPLSRLDADDQRSVWTSLAEGGEPITGKRVLAAVRRHLGEDTEQEEPSAPAEESCVDHVMLRVPMNAIEDAARIFAAGMPVDKLEQFARELLKHAKRERAAMRDQNNQTEVR
jgi:hypothetical protein